MIFIGALCFLSFLAEGAILDWSALLLTVEQGLDASRGGLGYAAFAIAMTVGRLTGDRVVRALGGKRVLLLGGVCGAAGFFLSVLAPSVPLALMGFVLIGLGASNVVPILFTAAGNQKAMPASLAISAVTTLGYAGILAGAGDDWLCGACLQLESSLWRAGLLHAADRRQRPIGRGD